MLKIKQRRSLILICLMFLLLLSSCSSVALKSESVRYSDGMEDSKSNISDFVSGEKSEDRVVNNSLKEAAEGKENKAGSSVIYRTKTDDPNQKIIYTFNYLIDTLDFTKAEEELMRVVKETNSYLSDIEVKYDYGNKNGMFLVRVPKESSEAFQEKITKVGIVTSHSLSSDDMTQYYKDVEADKKITEIKEERLLELLKKSTKIEDMIKLEKELSELAFNKMQYDKDLRDIDHDVKYQTFKITIKEVVKTGKPVTKPINFNTKLEREFKDSIDGVKSFIESSILIFVRWWIPILGAIIVSTIILLAEKKRRKSPNIKKESEIANISKEENIEK